MPRAMRIRVESHVIGEPVAGVWCEHCKLPSAFGFLVVVVPVHNPMTPWWRGHMFVCHDCDARWNEKLTGAEGPRAFD